MLHRTRVSVMSSCSVKVSCKTLCVTDEGFAGLKHLTCIKIVATCKLINVTLRLHY